MMADFNNSSSASPGGYELTDVWTDGVVLLVFNVFLWLVSLPFGTTWPVDLVWSNFPIYTCIAICVRDEEERGNRDRQLMVVCLVCVWGFRLSHNFVARGGIGHEDWRYADMRVRIGRWFWFVSFFSVFLGQCVFLWSGTLSLYGALTTPAPIGSLDWIALVVTLFSILLEAISDIQMNNFIALRKEKKTDKVVIDTGVWSWSRHPNYLGEILFWWGLYFFSMAGRGNDGRNEWWVVLGPVAMTILIGVISTKLMEDRQLANKGRAFVQYRRKVGSPLMILPPGLNRLLGRCLYGSGDEDDGNSSSKNNYNEEDKPQEGSMESKEEVTTIER